MAMVSLWIGTLFYTLQVTGAIVWIPIVLTILGMVGISIINSFIMGSRFEKKADKKDLEDHTSKKLDKEQYYKDKSDIAILIDKKADKEVLEMYMKLTNGYYVALHERMEKLESINSQFIDSSNKREVEISGKLATIAANIENWKEYCNKQTAKQTCKK